MNEALKKLNIKGYTYDPDCEDKLGSIFYIEDKNEDNWIRISQIKKIKPQDGEVLYETYIITFVVGCEDTKLEISGFDESNIENFEKWINTEIESL